MHDSDIVALEIIRPWPQRSSLRLHGVTPRWRVGRRRFWTLAGHEYYWPALITIWHREPGGHDSGEVCRHWKPARLVVKNSIEAPQRDRDDSWRWHVHHWQVQVPALQALRRTLLTRCTWCGGRSRRGDVTNVSHSWDHERTPWWRGERGLYHMDCSTVASAHRTCTCRTPLLEHEDYGQCAVCGLFRAFGQVPRWTWLARELRLGVAAGTRDRERYQQAITEAQRRFDVTPTAAGGRPA